MANSGGSQNEEDSEWNSTEITLDGRKMDPGNNGARGVAPDTRTRKISGTGDRSDQW